MRHIELSIRHRPIDWLSLREHTLYFFEPAALIRQCGPGSCGGGIAVDASIKLRRITAKINPNRLRVRHRLPSLRLHERAAAQGDHLIVALAKLARHRCFSLAERGFAAGLPDLGDGGAIKMLANPLIHIHEIFPELVGKFASQARFPAASITDQYHVHGANCNALPRPRDVTAFFIIAATSPA